MKNMMTMTTKEKELSFYHHSTSKERKEGKPTSLFVHCKNKHQLLRCNGLTILHDTWVKTNDKLYTQICAYMNKTSLRLVNTVENQVLIYYNVM